MPSEPNPITPILPPLTPEQIVRKDKLDKRERLKAGRIDYQEAEQLFALIHIAAKQQLGSPEPDVEAGDESDGVKFIAMRHPGFAPFGEWIATMKRGLDNAKSKAPALPPLPPLPDFLWAFTADHAKGKLQELADRVYARQAP